jgi:hypothetical protein
VTLPPRVHVYAPGVEHYKPIELEIDPPSAGFKVAPAAYPPPKVMRLPVIDETVPVYEGRLRIARDVVVSSDPHFVREVVGRPGGPGAAVTLAGRLKYQACDDRRCYRPDVVPLSWTLQVRQVDPVRPRPENWKVKGG